MLGCEFSSFLGIRVDVCSSDSYPELKNHQYRFLHLSGDQTVVALFCEIPLERSESRKAFC